MPTQYSATPRTVHTVTLEDQGVPADIAAHRRSIHASDACCEPVLFDRWNPNVGRRTAVCVPCQNQAISLVNGKNYCETHRLAGLAEAFSNRIVDQLTRPGSPFVAIGSPD